MRPVQDADFTLIDEKASSRSAAPRFTVVIPTYRGVGKIHEPVESLNAQKFRDFEVVICDDQSDDIELLKLYLRENLKSDYRLVQLNRHRNQVAGRLVGSSISRGDMIALLDHDDAWLPEKLDYVDKFVRSSDDEKSAIFYHQLICRDAHGRSFLYPRRGIRSGESVPSYLFLGNGMIQSSSMIFSRGLLDKLTFDETSPPHDDWDLSIKASSNGLKMRYIDRPLAIWNIRRMAGVSERDRSGVSIDWLSRNASLFDNLSRSAFLINVVFPKMVAEKRFLDACRVVVGRLGRPIMLARSAYALLERYRMKRVAAL